MLAPKEVLDAVVVHELCHLFEMNHSPRFYSYVLSVYPDYKKWYKWLRDNGAVLQATVPGRQ
jgi:predicted metal-dependent hydrolase